MNTFSLSLSLSLETTYLFSDRWFPRFSEDGYSLLKRPGKLVVFFQKNAILMLGI